MVRRRRTRPPYPLRPQVYEDRVEVVVEALHHALSACRNLTEFLLAEQTPTWGRDDFLRAASGDLRRAQRWLAKRKR
ncbi:MAG: hypothetical protein NTW87_06135 [Planctomycetota bacterium]|nr:hypothetical protein [Planctomycetota bacterium]